MKKILLACVWMASIATYAQNLTVTQSSPTGGSTITAGTAFTFSGTINNIGSAQHKSLANGDTCIYLPLFNGSALGNGQGGVVAWYFQDAIAAGASGAFTKQLNVSGGSSGNLEICSAILFFGSSYTTSTARDTSNVCANVTYNSMYIGDFKLTETFDNSFFSNGTYFVQVSSKVNLNQPSIEIVDLNGKTVLVRNLEANGGEITQEISLEGFAKGMYVVKLGTKEGLISIRKIMN